MSNISPISILSLPHRIGALQILPNKMQKIDDVRRRLGWTGPWRQQGGLDWVGEEKRTLIPLRTNVVHKQCCDAQKFKDICLFEFMSVKVLRLHMPTQKKLTALTFWLKIFFWLTIGPFLDTRALYTPSRVWLAAKEPLCKQKPHRRHVHGTSHSVASRLLTAEFDTVERLLGGKQTCHVTHWSRDHVLQPRLLADWLMAEEIGQSTPLYAPELYTSPATVIIFGRRSTYRYRLIYLLIGKSLVPPTTK